MVEAEDILEQTLRRPRWHASAACAGKTHLFFLERGASPDPGKALCATCPVIRECHAAAAADGSLQGMWAGQSQQERRTRRRDVA